MWRSIKFGKERWRSSILMNSNATYLGIFFKSGYNFFKYRFYKFHIIVYKQGVIRIVLFETYVV